MLPKGHSLPYAPKGRVFYVDKPILEVQRADNGARPERARYHASALDVENLDAGQQFEELPTTYIIFVTENDIFKAGKALYPIVHLNMATGEPFEDRQYILYANASY